MTMNIVSVSRGGPCMGSGF